jgi:hypothetical protein
MAELNRRLNAIEPSPELMRDFALQAVREQKLLVPRKTGHLGRSIVVGAVTARSAETVAQTNYAAAVEYGSREHDILPRRRKALRFATDASDRRLSGRPRKGARSVVFAKRVRHPGTKAQPFMVPGAERAAARGGFIGSIVSRWNGAA